MDDDGLPNARPIALRDSPRCQRSQSSVFSAAVKPRKYLRPIAVHSFPFQDRVLRGPVETTALRWGKRPALLWIREEIWVLRFRLMVKRGHRGYGPQASEGEAQHGAFCWIGCIGQGNERLYC